MMSANIIKIDDQTWRIEDEFVYYYLLAGEKKAFLIDSGMTEPNVKEIISELTDLPVTLVNTHGDGDHVGGNGSFDGYYIHPEDYVKNGLKQRFADIKQCNLAEGDSFDLGNRTLKVIEIPGHTYGSVAFLDVENRVLYGGDTVQDGIIYMFGPHRCPDQLKGSLEKLIALCASYDIIRPAHGTPELAKNYAEFVLEDWDAVLNGELDGVDEELLGNPVKTCRGKHCGFYIQR